MNPPLRMHSVHPKTICVFHIETEIALLEGLAQSLHFGDTRLFTQLVATQQLNPAGMFIRHRQLHEQLSERGIRRMYTPLDVVGMDLPVVDLPVIESAKVVAECPNCTELIANAFTKLLYPDSASFGDSL